MPIRALKRYTNSTLFSAQGLIAAGSAAVVGGLHLVGAIGPWWWVVALSTYSGVLLVPVKPSPKAEPPAPDATAAKTTRQALDWLQNHGHLGLPVRAQLLLGEIQTLAEDLLPRLKALEEQGVVQVENRFELKQTLKMFLPQAIERFRSLPPGYAKSVQVAEGKTSEDVLIEQFELLKEHVLKLQRSALAPDVDALLAQSRYLNGKLTQQPLLLESP